MHCVMHLTRTSLKRSPATCQWALIGQGCAAHTGDAGVKHSLWEECAMAGDPMSTHMCLGTGCTSVRAVMAGQACPVLARNTHLSGQHIFWDSALWQGRPRMFSGHLSAGFQHKLCAAACLRLPGLVACLPSAQTPSTLQSNTAASLQELLAARTVGSRM